jgi:hypothetical protein
MMHQICIPPSHQSQKAPIVYLSPDVAYTEHQSVLACHRYNPLLMYMLLEEYHSELKDIIYRWQVVSGVECPEKYIYIVTERNIMQAIENAIHKQCDVYLFDSHKECMKFIYTTLDDYYTQ